MDKDQLRGLFERISENRFSQQDIEDVNQWYHDLNAGDENLKQWFLESGGEEVLAEHLYSSFKRNIVKQKRKLKISRFVQAAAILILIFGVGITLFFNHSKTSKHHLAVKNVVQQVKEEKNARLTLDNGSNVNIKDLAFGNTVLSGATIEKTSDGKLIYKVEKIAQSEAIKYNTITTPRGSQFEIILPDGTHVWLNAASSLKFPLRFQGSERRVSLQGEGYFEVAHDRKMPFKVQSGIQTVTVLGTHFIVKAYQDEQSISTTLFQGSVNVQNNKTNETEKLEPGKQAEINIGRTGIKVSKADLDQALSWKNGYFIFDNQDVKSIMALISRWYDVDIEYHITSEERFGGTFYRSSDLQELLKNLESLGKTKFQLKERKVIVSN